MPETRPGFALLLLALVTLALPGRAAELKKETSKAFDHYIAVSEARINGEAANGPFLFIDELPPAVRTDAYNRLRRGEVRLRQLTAQEEGHPLEVPHGLIHDWVGLIFIPHTTLAQVLSVAQDYDHYRDIYKPEIRESRLLEHTGDHYKVHLQLYKKSMATVVTNAEYDITYQHPTASRALCRSVSTRLAEVENLGQKSERELSPDSGHGYIWRLNTYWRLEEKDGGVYVQLESIGLSRGVPAVVAWIVNHLLRSIPRGTITGLLAATERAVREKGG